MIAQQYINRISVKRNSYRRSVPLPPAEDILRQLAIAMVAIVLMVGCVKGAASLWKKEAPAVKVTVRQGDTLWEYASTYGNKDKYILSRIDEIARVNNLEMSRAIQPGMKIVVPR